MAGTKYTTYFVVEASEIDKILRDGPSVKYTMFIHVGEAVIFKTGLETMNPEKKYGIMRRVPEQYDLFGEITGEKEEPGPFGYN